MWRVVAGLLAASAVPHTRAVSSGDVGLCNPEGNAGCSRWAGNNRLSCNEPGAGIMPWTSRPVPSSAFTVETVGGVTGYVPGALVQLRLQVHDYGSKYRGLLMDAVDENNVTVGEFQFAPAGQPESLFWEPPRCPGAVGHKDANPKPFVVTLTWQAPQAGTGGVRFRCLLKTGPANTGAFWYPATSVMLTEVPIALAPSPITVSMQGESCSSHCQSTGLVCNGTALSSTLGFDGLERALTGSYSCAPPAVAECASAAPGLDASGTCLFRGGTALCAGSVAAADCSDVAATSDAHCNAVHPSIRRFCSCVPPPTPSPTQSPPPPPSPTQSPTPPSRVRRGATSAASTAGVPHTVTTVSAAVLAMSCAGMSGRTITAALVLAAWVRPTEAHNWLFSPSRAMTEASTTAPCRSRKSETDWHAQVGPDQSFVVKWATGHERQVYWVILHGSNESWLSNRRFTAMVNDYIDNAPPGADLATDPRYQRYHSVRPRRKAAFDRALPTQSYYGSELDPSDPNYLNHSHEATPNLYRFNANVLAQDRRVSYASAQYPWIESAFRYTIQSQNNAAALDFDATRVTIPGRAGPGHYIVHWRWSGYYDCTDVLYFNDRQVPTDRIDGLMEPGNVWGKIDHCQYTPPFRQVLSRCLPATNGAQACLDQVNQAYYNATDSASFHGLTPRFLDRIGINVVPIQNPNSSAFPDQVNIPWMNHTCGNADMTRLTGPVSYDTPSSTLVSRTRNQTVGRVCTASSVQFVERTSMRSAMQRCSVMRYCNYLVWERTNTSGGLWDGGHIFRGCSATRSAASAQQQLYTAFSRPAEYNPYYDMSAPRTWTRTFSFQPSTAQVTLPVGWLADTGGVFQQRGNVQYGWRCPLTATYLRATSNVLTQTVNTTQAVNLHLSICPDGSRNKWEVAVPNGVYKVTTGHNTSEIRGQGCIVEKTQLVGREIRRGPVNSYKVVEVSDGRLTFETINDIAPFRDVTSGFLHRSGCSYVNYIAVERVGSAPSLPELWFPASSTSSGAWRQERLSERVPVGLVSLEFPVQINMQTPAQVSTGGFLTSGAVNGNGVAVGQPHQTWAYDCRMGWLFKGGHCAQLTYSTQRVLDSWNSEGRHRPLGVFSDTRTEGAVVSVSDTPCDANGCPGGTVCQRLEAQHRVYGTYTTATGLDVDCRGAVGQYLRVHLPGGGRIFAAQVSVNRANVFPTQPNQMVCYAVHARIATQTTPEFITTSDPLDPIFYSTCYVRERKITWLPSPVAQAVPTPHWAFNNNTCLTCDSFSRNQAEPDRPNDYTVPIWVFADECVDCDASDPLGNDPLTCAASASASSSSSNSALSIGVAVTVILLVLIIATLGLVAHRRRQGLPANPFGRAYGKPARFRAAKRRPQPLADEGLDAVASDGGSAIFSNPTFEATDLPLKPTVPKPTRKPQIPVTSSTPRAAVRPSLPTHTSHDDSVPTQVWEGVVADGKVYYINSATDQTQWESPLPAGWEAVIDGERVYYSHENGEAQWEFPHCESEA